MARQLTASAIATRPPFRRLGRRHRANQGRRLCTRRRRELLNFRLMSCRRALMVVDSPSPVLRRSPAYRVLARAGLLAGCLDLTAAFVEADLAGRSPISLLQGIAGGLLGISSFRGGAATAALGAFFHFLIATRAAAVFSFASRKLTLLIKHAIVSGLLYGVVVYIFMYYIVLPISAYHTKVALPRMAELTRDVAVHMFLVGLPISLVVRKYSDARCTEGRATSAEMEQ